MTANDSTHNAGAAALDDNTRQEELETGCVPAAMPEDVETEPAQDIDSAEMSREAEDAHATALEHLRREHAEEMHWIALDYALEKNVFLAGGRNIKAIAALLDREALYGAAEPEAAITQAVLQLKETDGYLFLPDYTVPEMAHGCGLAPVYTSSFTAGLGIAHTG